MFYNNVQNSSRRATGSSLLWAVPFLILSLFSAPAVAQHLHQLNYDNVWWVDTDLTALTDGPQPFPVAASNYTTSNDQFHVFYVSQNDFHIHQLYYNGSVWSDSDITATTGGEASNYYSSLATFSIGNAQYVYFCGNDNVLHEISYGDKGKWNWVDATLPTRASGQACANYAPGPLAFAPNANHRYVFYQSTISNQNHIRRLFYNGTKWTNLDITQKISGTNPLSAYRMSGFISGAKQYVFFEGTDKHVHEYSYVTSWADQDLTRAAHISVKPAGVGAALLVPGTPQIEVYYAAASNQHLHRMSFESSKWKDTDLSVLTSASVYPNEALIAFATAPNDQLHVYTLDANYVVDQFFFDGTSWTDQSLPSVSTFTGPIAGFALGNLQYVYYVSAN
jgi:hypothetical protein